MRCLHAGLLGLIELVALAVDSLVQPERSAIGNVRAALWLTLASRFPGRVGLLALLRLLLLLLITGLALLGLLLKLLLTGLILLRALLGLLRWLDLLFLGLLALHLLLLLLIARLPLLVLLGALLGLLLQLPLRLLLPHRLFLQGALADGIFGLPTLLLLLPRRVNLLALLVAPKPLLLGARALFGVKCAAVWHWTWLRQRGWNNLRGLAGPGQLPQAFCQPTGTGGGLRVV